MTEPQYYELHKCCDCHLISMIIGFTYVTAFKKKILFVQPTLTTKQGFEHDVTGKCGDMIQKVTINNPEYKTSGVSEYERK